MDSLQIRESSQSSLNHPLNVRTESFILAIYIDDIIDIRKFMKNVVLVLLELFSYF